MLGVNEGREPIAVVGIGCRFPAGGDSPSGFWRVLREKVDAVGPIPLERRRAGSWVTGTGEIGPEVTGGFLPEVDRFDAGFFSIAPKEAIRVDPQQRLMLELGWEALEDAGLVPERLAGAPVGVFVGIASSDYGRLQAADPNANDGYAMTGGARSIAANRLSFFFDFRGPSIAVDTACSSSLVAVHLALQSLRDGECDLALVGGVNLVLATNITSGMSSMGALAKDGRCKAFDARADGYVRSEGAGMVVLKPLAKARADGDRIYALIRGSAVNQDGRTNGITAPSQRAQEAVLRDAYRRSGVSPRAVQYVEAHGTGTLLGDPIEAKALGAVLGAGREQALRVGSVKTNLGHLEAAAGIAGLIKVVLSLHHDELPATLHFQKPNPHIPFEGLHLEVQREHGGWPEGDERFAGVSAFGFGGTNAHVVLQAAPRETSERPAPPAGPDLLLLSAKSPRALRELALRVSQRLSEPAAPTASLCASLALRRTHHLHRLGTTGTREQLARQLASFAEHGEAELVHAGKRGSPRLVFVFPGQGSQWARMGQGLIAHSPVFAETMRACDGLIRARAGFSVLEEISTGRDLARIDIVQPALFAIQVSLAAMFRSHGVVPDALVGHSMGEVAAAHVAGALGLEDAVRVICERSRLMRTTSGKGAMLAVELTVEEARAQLADFAGRASVAATNSPRSTVLSGDPEVLSQLRARLEARGLFCRPIKVDVASHSPQMEPLCPELLRSLQGLRPMEAKVPICSTVLADAIEGEAFTPAYWTRNLREPVLFSESIRKLREDGFDTFLELSPHPILLPTIEQNLAAIGAAGRLIPAMRRESDERATLLSAMAALHVAGREVELEGLVAAASPFEPFSTYPWQRERHWFREPPTDAGKEQAPATPAAPPRAEPISERTDEPVETFVLRKIAAVLGQAPESLDPEVPLTSLGIDSLMVVQLQRALEARTGVKVPVARFFQGLSIRELLGELAGNRSGGATADAGRVVTFGRGERVPLLCVHPGALDPSAYAALARGLPDRPLHVLLPTGLDAYLAGGSAQQVPSIEGVIDHCVQLIERTHPQGPLAIAGWSLGAAVAFAAAERLRARGREIQLIALFDPAQLSSTPPRDLHAGLAASFARFIGARSGRASPITFAELFPLSAAERLAHVASRTVAQGSPLDPTTLGEHFELFREGVRISLERVKAIGLRPANERLLLFRSTEDYDGSVRTDDLGWRPLALSGLEIHAVPGDHYSIWLEANVAAIAGPLSLALERV